MYNTPTMHAEQRPVIQAKLTPPRPQRHTLHRPRITQRLRSAGDYRLTILQAGAGYGKSTALTALAQETAPLVWYHLEADDADPLRFVRYLIHGLARAVPPVADAPLALLEQWERAERPLQLSPIVDVLLNELSAFPATTTTVNLVLDDAHLLNRSPETCELLSRLIDFAPPTLNIFLSTRNVLRLPNLVKLRVRGELQEISQGDLSFTSEEVIWLYENQYGLELTPAQGAALAEKVEGWAMALPLVGQRLRRGGARTISDALDQLSGSTSDLFTYLTHEILEQQPAHIQAFLRATAVLKQLTPALCDCLTGREDAVEILTYLQHNGLFVISAGDQQMRYHHLFRELLQAQTTPEAAAESHRRAAECFEALGEYGTAVDHWLQSGEYTRAAERLVTGGRQFVSDGQLDLLQSRIVSLPPDTLARFPTLLIYLGDIHRLHSRFDEALGWYQQAETQFRATQNLRGIGQALRGQARVYLDTVNPAQAEQLLQEALRLSDGEQDRETRARLLDLLAENHLNLGQLEEAQRFRQQARALRQQAPDQEALPLRLMLRTGRLAEARRQLEEMAVSEAANPIRRPRAHRETLLLLSLVYAFFGDQEQAHATAVQGTERGQELDSPYISAVGWMRQGHAWLLLKNKHGYEQAERAFQRAIDISNQIEASRLRVEAYWGLTQAYGFRGNLAAAEASAVEGLRLAEKAGDEWVAACIAVAEGAGYVLANDYTQSATHLARAVTAFRACSDTHGETVACLWQTLQWRALGDTTRLRRDVELLLSMIRDHDYRFLLTERTLLGPPDPRMLVPLLVFARDEGICESIARELLEQLGLDRVEMHPGYQLRVHALGPFRVWLGQEELPAGAWRRKKARQLFQLFLTNRRTLLHREQITEMLWPELTADDAARDFKIAYNALTKVLEPARERNAPSAYVLRAGSRYGLRPEADVWLDAAVFDDQISAGDRLLHTDANAARRLYRSALALYQGDYLLEFPYEEWADQERKRLLNRYIRTAERLARSLLQAGDWEEAVEVAQALLLHDNCWEPAYQVLMTAYTRLGNRTQALRVYQQCVDTLWQELGIAPTAVTAALHADLLG